MTKWRVVLRARERGVCLAGINDEHIAFLQLDRFLLEPNRGGAACDEVDLRDAGVA